MKTHLYNDYFPFFEYERRIDKICDKIIAEEFEVVILSTHDNVEYC